MLKAWRRIVCCLSVSKEERREEEKRNGEMWIFTIQKPQRASLWSPRHGVTIVFYFTPFLPDSFSSLWVSRSSTTWPMWAKWSPSDICLSRICGQFKMNCLAKVNEVKSFTFWWSIKIKSRNETSFACVWFQLLLCDYEGKEAETKRDLCPRVKWKPDCVRNLIVHHPCIPPGCLRQNGGVSNVTANPMESQ